jgi:hypothetical protein
MQPDPITEHICIPNYKETHVIQNDCERLLFYRFIENICYIWTHCVNIF